MLRKRDLMFACLLQLTRACTHKLGWRAACSMSAFPQSDHTADIPDRSEFGSSCWYEGHLGVLRLRRIREDAAERQGGDKQRKEDAFHGAPILRLADRSGIRLLPVSGGAIRR